MGHAGRYVAADLGAESGRIMAGTMAGGRMMLAEAHRFPNTPVRTPDGLHWNVLQLFANIVTGLRAAQADHHEIAGVGVDSWAIDYGLLDGGGRLLGNPYSYRDVRTDGVREEVARIISPEEQYRRTGIAQLPFNTIYQLVAQRRAGDPALHEARSLLHIPDLLHYWLSGEQAMERTNASTTGLLDTNGTWADDMLVRLDIPRRMLLDPVPPGTVLGGLRPAVQEEASVGRIPVIAPATHDTASAVVAVPFGPKSSGTSAYVSSGTWSLLGLELPQAVTTEEARLAGFTNEHGVRGTYRFLTNIMGLWLVQECRRSWERHGEVWSYDLLTRMAEAAPLTDQVIDVNDPAFLHPSDMPDAIEDQLRRTGQGTIDGPGPLVRTLLEGLALAYRAAVEQAETVAGAPVQTIHVVGGGARNTLLCQLTADAAGRQVLAGPVEATALGNVLTQALARGELATMDEVREVARASAQVSTYEPQPAGIWDERYGRLLQMQSRLAVSSS